MRVDFSNVSSGFEPIPEGEYLATVFNVEQKTSMTSGQPYLNWQFKIQGGECDGRRAFYMTSLQPQSLWKLKGDLMNLGFTKDDLGADFDLDLASLPGRECVIVITHELYNGETRDSVNAIKPSGNGIGSGSSAAAGGAPLYR